MARGDLQLCGYGTESEFGSHLQHLRSSHSHFCLPLLLSCLMPFRPCPSSRLAAIHGKAPTQRTCCSRDFGARAGRVGGRGSAGSEIISVSMGKTLWRWKCPSDLCCTVGHQGQSQVPGPGSPCTSPGISYSGLHLQSTKTKKCLQKVIDVLLTAE